MLSASMAAMGLTGCGSDNVDGTKTAVTVNDESITLGQANFMLRYQQATMYNYYSKMYSMYGMQMPSEMYDKEGDDGKTTGETFKEQSLDTIEKELLMRQHAEEYGISLTDEEKQQAKEAAQAFADKNGDDVMKKLHATVELPQTREEKKIPVFKAGSLGISLRRPLHEQQAAEKQEAKAASTAAQNDATYEDYIFNEKDLDYYWREFAAALPKEEKANSARMMNMHPHLLNDTTFEVTVDNDMVEKYMVQLIPSVQNHLRERLHNRKITMTVRVSAPTENIRAYSHVERFQMMSKKNPNLLKLKEALGLELS